jgi:hypothetical protein
MIQTGYAQSVQIALDRALGLYVQVAGGFVQNQDSGPGCQSASQRDALALPPRESAAPFTHTGLVTHRQALNLVVDGSQSRRACYIFQSHIRLLQSDIFANRTAEQKRLLQYYADPPTQIDHSQLINRLPAKTDDTRLGLVEADQQTGKRTLARTGRPDNRHFFAGGYGEGNPMQAEAAFLTVIELESTTYRASGCRQPHGSRTFLLACSSYLSAGAPAKARRDQRNIGSFSGLTRQ